MNVLDYLKFTHGQQPEAAPGAAPTFSVNLVTNFTDDILQKILNGVMLANGVRPDVFAVPYKQYHIHLKDPSSPLYTRGAQATFFFFDANEYRRSEFSFVPGHVREVIADIETYTRTQNSPVIVTNFITPYVGVYGNLFAQSPFYAMIEEANSELKELSKRLTNLYICDINSLVHRHGERSIRDFRGMYAFDTPFANHFLAVLAEEWFTYIRVLMGNTKKCVVVDLDNTLWGGVVGETGPLGIALGPEYPGLAFQNFQHALLELYKRGIILAVNSKNNADDVREVFAENPHMILGEKHFAAMRTNWDDKAKNLLSIAEELNIGVDSLVFLDDDALNRNLVRSTLPGVTVPELPERPEEYVHALYSLDLFNQFSLTEEDLEKAKMYADERQRKDVQYSAQNVHEYVKALGIVITVGTNDKSAIPRLSQMTQKTNQFNITTKRYSEGELLRLIDEGALIFSGSVRDKFGEYGKTAMAIVRVAGGIAELDTYLMSCRVMGRGVEGAFMAHVAESLRGIGVERLKASFIKTAKNKPAENFLPALGFAEIGRTGDSIQYAVELRELRSGDSAITIVKENHE